MRNRYIVTYDISDDDRRNSIFKTLRGCGDHIQYSVFRCDLSDSERITPASAMTTSDATAAASTRATTEDAPPEMLL